MKKQLLMLSLVAATVFGCKKEAAKTDKPAYQGHCDTIFVDENKIASITFKSWFDDPEAPSFPNTYIPNSPHPAVTVDFGSENILASDTKSLKRESRSAIFPVKVRTFSFIGSNADWILKTTDRAVIKATYNNSISTIADSTLVKDIDAKFVAKKYGSISL